MACRFLPPVMGPFFIGVLRHRQSYSFVGRRRMLNVSQTYNLVPMPLEKTGFSTRSGREGKGSGFRMEARAGSSKSLIDDEAELSDWVSGLSSSSRKKSLYTESEGDDGGNERFRGRDVGGKRRRDSAMDGGFDSHSKRRGASLDSFSGSRRGIDRETGNYPRGGKFEGRFSESKGRSNGFMGRGGKGMGEGRQTERMGGTYEKSSPKREFFGKDNENGFMSRGNGRQTERRFDSMDSRGRNGGSNFKTYEKSTTQRDFLDKDSRRMGEGRQTERVGGRGGKYEKSPPKREFYGKDNENGFMNRGNRGSGEGRQTGRRFDSMDSRGRNGGSNFKTYEKSTPKSDFLDTDDDHVTEDEVEEGSNLYVNSNKLIKSDEDEDEDEDDYEDEDEDEDDDGIEEHDEKDEDIQRVAFTLKSSTGSESYLSESRFDECQVSPLSLKAVKDAGYERMTMVQEATLPVILKGKDVLAKAKTGTGKTVAFLLPAIEVVVKLPQTTQSEKRPPILVLVICPTRELACQAAAEANKLLKYHPTIGTQVVIGGTRLAQEQKRMQANPCQILVATPGRLRDHIENTAGFATRLMGVKVLVLDEADHLLGLGFRKEIERIVDAVPKQRQTLLFSATVPQEVRQICHIALKRDHEFINTVKEGGEDTHSQVRQTHLVTELDNHFSILYTLLKEHISDDVHYKVLVFCTTAMMTKLVAEFLGQLNLNVREIHSRKSQSYRTKISDEFRKSTAIILVTSDVSARGVDYPDVTLVLQMGLPADKQQYVHRLGRTGRKGKEGQGILLLAPWEEFFLSNIKDLPLSKASVPIVDPDTRKKVDRGLSDVEMRTKESAYQAWLGYYNSNSNVGRDKLKLVELANDFSRSMGLDTPPAIPKLVLGKMGLKNVPGLRTK